MKLNGIIGKGSGKLGSSVFAVSGGEQIVREYNPKVTNPNTEPQIAQRAKLKLMSQLAAALALVLAYKKNGLISARNQFVSRNIGAVNFVQGQGATVALENLKLTSGTEQLVLGSDAFVQDGMEVIVTVPLSIANSYDTFFLVTIAPVNNSEDSPLKIVDFTAGSPDGTDNPTILGGALVEGRNIVYVYGVKYASASVRVSYDSYFWQNASNDAKLAALRNLATSGAIYSDTSAHVFENVVEP